MEEGEAVCVEGRGGMRQGARPAPWYLLPKMLFSAQHASVTPRAP